MDIHQKMLDSGYTYQGHTYVGDKYTRGPFTVYHSGYLLMFIREGGMIRSFPDDRLCFFTVEDMERQTSALVRRFDMKEETANYDYYRKL